MFYIIHIAAINAYLLYCRTHPEFLNHYKNRAGKEFIKLVTGELLLPKNYDIDALTTKRLKK